MKIASLLLTCLFTFSLPALGQNPDIQSPFDAGYNLSLPSHPGQLQWQADGFRVVEASAKSKGQEIGLRGMDPSGRITFLGFLFLVPEQAPLSSEKCRAGALSEQKNNPSLKLLESSPGEGSTDIPIALASYSAQGPDGKKVWVVRGFVATGDICGDLEFYGQSAIHPEDPDLAKIFRSFRLDASYISQFKDVFLYAQILYKHQMYQAAAPVFEQALSKLDVNDSSQTMRRVTVDQAGMSYGISGDIQKARAIFEAAIAKDPDYPMYYYNLACADAGEKKLADARLHLQEAFARRGNVIPGEKLPDPTKDDSFLPYRNNRDFWKFLEALH